MGKSRVATIILLGTVARVILGATIGLGVDESYAVAVARPLSLSYFDHPPLVFWIAGVASRAFGTAHDVLLRLPFILLFAATSWLLYRLTAYLFGERAGLLTAILAQIIPVFGVSDGSWILPDGPLLLGFAGSALCLAHALFDGSRARAPWWWLGAGVGAGVAALSKYHAIFLIAGTLLFLLTSPRHRHWLRRAEPHLAGIIALAMATPVIVWNARHGWASFRFQGGRAGAQLGIRSLTALAQNLAGQMGYLLPWVWVPLVWLFVRAARRGPNDAGSWLLVCLGGGPVVVFTLLVLGGRAGLPHWPAPGFFLLLPLLGDALARSERRGRPVRLYLSGSAVLVGTLLTVAATQIRTGWLGRRFPTLFAHGDPSLEAVDWRAARTLLDTTGSRRVVIAASWIDAAKLGAALAPDVVVLCFSDDPRHFRYVIDQNLLIGSNATVVLRSSPRTDLEGDRRRIAAHFGAVDSAPERTIEIRRGETVAVKLEVFRATALVSPYGVASRPLP